MGRIVPRRLAAAIVAAVLVVSGGVAGADTVDDAVVALMQAENVAATGISPTHVYLQWTKRPQSQETANRIEMSSTEDGIYETLTVAGKCVVATACSQVLTFSAAPADTEIRWFRVVPVFATPSQVGGQELIPGKPSKPDPAILGPLPPTGLTCNLSAKCENTQNITLRWTDNSDEQSFWVMRARGTINPNFGATFYAELPPNATMYTETVNEVATSYTYKVTAVRKRAIQRVAGPPTTELSFTDSATTLSAEARQHVQLSTPPIQPPAPPAGLTATFLPPDQARLTWTDNAPGADGFEEDGFYLEWGPRATEFTAQTSLMRRSGTGAVSHTVTLPSEAKRCYRIRSYRFGPAYSAYSPSPASSEPGVCVGPIPARPTGVTASALSSALVRVTWTDASAAESSFAVERCAGACTASSTGWQEIGAVPEDVTTFDDTGTDPLTTYSYRVYARNATGSSPASAIVTVKTPQAAVLAPDSLSAVPIGSHAIRLTWVDRATNETGYRIEFRARGGEWFHLVDKAANTVTHDDSFGLPANTERCYRVRALRGSEFSQATGEACATTFPPQPPNGVPSGLAVVNAGNKSLKLTWTDNATNEDSFRLEYIVYNEAVCGTQNVAGVAWKTMATLPAKGGTGTVTFDATGLTPHSAYFLRVKAINIDGVSAASNVECGATLGPRRPIFHDPTDDADIEATRCTIDVAAFLSDTDVVEFTVIAKLATGWVVDGPIRVDEPEDGQTRADGRDVWRLSYRFRKGPTYAVRAVNVGYEPNRYQSALVELKDLKVLADCPTEL